MSSDGTQLSLSPPRTCVISCNISNEHGSLLSTARLTLLPPGMTPLSASYITLLTYFIILPFTLAL